MDPAPLTQNYNCHPACSEEDWELVGATLDAAIDVGDAMDTGDVVDVGDPVNVAKYSLSTAENIALESFFEHAEVLTMPQSANLNGQCTCSASKLLPYYLELVSSLKKEKRALELQIKLLESSNHMIASIKALIKDICMVGIICQVELTIGILEFV